MDPQILDDVAHSVVKLRMYPFFDIAHYVLMSTAIRDDTPQSGKTSKLAFMQYILVSFECYT